MLAANNQDDTSLKNSLYEVLGVERYATFEQIRSSFRKKAINLHPDKNSTARAKEEFSAALIAYKVLSNPKKRAKYDRLLLKRAELSKLTPKFKNISADDKCFEPTEGPVNLCRALILLFLSASIWSLLIYLFI